MYLEKQSLIRAHMVIENFLGINGCNMHSLDFRLFITKDRRYISTNLPQRTQTAVTPVVKRKLFTLYVQQAVDLPQATELNGEMRNMLPIYWAPFDWVVLTCVSVNSLMDGRMDRCVHMQQSYRLGACAWACVKYKHCETKRRLRVVNGH